MLLLIDEQGKHQLVRDPKQDYHCKDGVVKASAMLDADPGTAITSHTGKRFFVVPATAVDAFGDLERGPQIMTQKDLGYILAKTMAQDVVIEAGSGSGAAACFFARYVNHVISYEQRPEHLAVAQRNVDSQGLENVDLHEGDIREADEAPGDLLLLDLPNPWTCLEASERLVKIGGFVVMYVPSTVQVQKAVQALKGTGFDLIETKEIIARDWHVRDRSVRPSHRGLGFTAFLIFARHVRKLQEQE